MNESTVVQRAVWWLMVKDVASNFKVQGSKVQIKDGSHGELQQMKSGATTKSGSGDLSLNAPALNDTINSGQAQGGGCLPILSAILSPHEPWKLILIPEKVKYKTLSFLLNIVLPRLHLYLSALLTVRICPRIQKRRRLVASNRLDLRLLITTFQSSWMAPLPMRSVRTLTTPWASVSQHTWPTP